MVYIFFDRKTSGGTVKNEIISNKELAEELHKPIIRKSNKRKVHSPFIDNIWGADLADKQLTSKFKKGFRFLLCVIDIYSKYAWVIPLKDKKGITITNGFQKILIIWADKDSEFYNGSKILFLQNNDTEMYPMYNEGKFVVTERFIITLKNKIYKYMTAIPNIIYIDKLDDIVNKYKNTYHSTIKMKPVDVKSNTYTDSSKEINNKDPKIKIGDTVRILKYKKNFAKGYTPNWSEEVFLIKKVKNTVSWTYVINDLNGEEIVGTFYKKELQKTNQKEFIIEPALGN